jgi:hypothetical protein
VAIFVYVMQNIMNILFDSLNSTVGITTVHILNGSRVGVLTPVVEKCSSLHVIETSSVALSASHPMGTGGVLSAMKAAGA